MKGFSGKTCHFIFFIDFEVLVCSAIMATIMGIVISSSPVTIVFNRGEKFLMKLFEFLTIIIHKNSPKSM